LRFVFFLVYEQQKNHLRQRAVFKLNPIAAVMPFAAVALKRWQGI